MTFFILLLYAAIGLCSGFLNGLLGISGGLITVPSLLFVFHSLGFPQEELMHLVLGTSLASMVVTSLASATAHNRKHAVLWSVICNMLPGLLLGAILGPFIITILSNNSLEVVFGLFTLAIGLYFFFGRKIVEESDSATILKGPLLNLIGLGIAMISPILGIGGGLFSVPSLVALKLPLKKAIGTAAAIGMIVTSIAAATLLYFGQGATITKYSISYLYLPAFVMISTASSLSAPAGAKLTHLLPARLLRKLFGAMLFLASLWVLFK